MIESLRILGTTAAVGDPHNSRIFTIFAIEDADHVAGNVAVGSAGQFHRKTIAARIDPDLAQRNFEKNVHPFAGDTIGFVIDPCARFRAHECVRLWMPTAMRARDDPFN